MSDGTGGSSNTGWIGVDLDGTLAHYDGFKGTSHIGEPIPAMVERVRGWLREGREVRVFTARAIYGGPVICLIEGWCFKHIGRILTVTAEKDFGMYQLWDDRAVGVELNTGKVRDPQC